MKKIAKMSLVAAVAVAGLTNVNAASLEEAIKNVDVSGQFHYRMQSKDSDGSVINTDNDIEVGVKVPVTDNVTAVFKIDNSPNNTNSTFAKADLEIEDYYFSYAKDDLTVNFGQQNIPSRQTDGKQGDGVVVLKKMGGLTLGGAFYPQTNAAGYSDLSSVLATGNVGSAKVLAQYVNISNVATGANLHVAAKVSNVSVSAEYAMVDMDSDDKKYSTTKLTAGGKLGMASVSAMYVMTGKDGSGSFDADSDAASELVTFQYGTGGKAEASVFAAKVTVPVMAKTSATLFALTGDSSKDVDVTEVFGQLTYKAAKNLTAYARVGTVEVGDADSVNRYRLDITYKF